MAIKLASGRDPYSAPLIDAEFPLTLDPAIYKGAWVISALGNMFYSDGEQWYANATYGIEVFQPPWEGVPDGWFSVIATPPGDLSDRNVIASKFDVSYVTPDAQTWPIVDPSNLFTDAAGTTPVISAPEPIGLLEDTTVPQINWFQDVSIDRPQWDQITRNGETVNVLKFDNLGQELKVNFPEAVSGTMVHVTSNGIYRAEVDIPAGEYNFGRWQPWDIEEIILLDRTLTESEYTQLKNELAKTRNRVTDITEDDWENLFRERPEVDVFSLPNVLADNPQVTRFINTFRDNDLTSVPAGLFANNPNATSFSGTLSINNLTSVPENLFANNPNVTDFTSTFRFNNLTSIPEDLFANNPNVTIFRQTFRANDLTSIPEDLFANNPNIVTLQATFRANDLTSIPENLFANNPDLEDLGGRFGFGTFGNNNLTSVPENLFANNPNIVTLQATFRSNNLTSIPENLFANNPNVTTFSSTFGDNNLTSVPAGLFDNQTQATNYENCFNDNDLDQTSVDNVLVSVQTSADANNLNDGELGIDGGTNATPSQTGKDAADALRARGWTVNLNGY